VGESKKISKEILGGKGSTKSFGNVLGSTECKILSLEGSPSRPSWRNDCLFGIFVG